MTKTEFYNYLNGTVFSTKESFLERVFEKFPTIDGEPYFVKSSSEKDLFLRMTKVLNDVLGDSWEYSFPIFDSVDYPAIVIKIEDFWITNSQGHRHYIEDLFVKVGIHNITNSNICFNHTIKGFRTTCTDIENFCGYTHSHIQGFERGLFTNHFLYHGRPYHPKSCYDTEKFGFPFCLGTSEITDVLSIINTSDFEEGLFEHFLLLLKETFKWESLEGVPYRTIKNISFFGYSKDFTMPSESVWYKFNIAGDFLKKHNRELTIILGEKIELVNCRKNSSIFKEYLIKEKNTKYLCIKNNLFTNIYKVFQETDLLLDNYPKKLDVTDYVFRGYPIPIRIRRTQIKGQKEAFKKYLETCIVHPDIFKTYTSLINIVLNSLFLHKYEKRHTKSTTN